jgi:hypothetical protein
VPTPAIDALIQIVKSMSGKTFATEARTDERSVILLTAIV